MSQYYIIHLPPVLVRDWSIKWCDARDRKGEQRDFSPGRTFVYSSIDTMTLITIKHSCVCIVKVYNQWGQNSYAIQ